MEERYIAAIDLGSSKLALTVAKICGEDVQIIFYKEIPSDGIRNSSVLNPAKVEKPLKELISQAEKELKIKILQVVVGMPRFEVQVETASGTVERSSESTILQEEIDNLKSMALESYPLDDPKAQILYGAVAQSFSTEDEFNQVESEIVGMVSETLEGNFKVFIGRKRPVANIDMIMNDLGIAIARKFFVPDVTAKAVLTNEEMVNGVALIDFGAGVTSVSVYQNKIMRHYASIPFGGKSITGDIRTESSISEELAENIKLAFGALQPNRLLTLSEKVIQINDENDVPIKQIPVKYLSEIMTERTKEIIDAVLYEILQSGFADSLRAGVVVTGGCANMTNLSNLIKEMSGYTVRIGFPRHLFSAQGCNGIAETSSTASIGMVLATKHDRINCTTLPEPEPEPEFEQPDEAYETATEPEVQPIAEETPVVETQTEIQSAIGDTGFMAAPIQEAVEEETYTPRESTYTEDPGFSFDGPTPYGNQPKAEHVEQGSLFSEEELPEKKNPKKTPKQTKPKKNFLVNWVKKIEVKMYDLYEDVQKDDNQTI